MTSGGQSPRPAAEPAQPAGGPVQPASGPVLEAGGPVLEVVGGHPSDEELAALTAVLAAVFTGRDPGARPGRPGASGWASRSRGLRAPLRHGPDAWRRSARPG
jgi:Acyl-CoA carboxylase epsilon subunit